MNLKTGSIKGHLITSQHDIHSGVCVCVRPGNTHTHRRVINDLLTCCIDDDVTTPPPPPPKSPSHRGKRQQQEMLSELRRRQGKDSRHVYEGKDGAIEDIITGTHTAGTHITHLSPPPHLICSLFTSLSSEDGSLHSSIGQTQLSVLL